MKRKAILFIGFNRPDFLQSRINTLTDIRKVYISIDGPRINSEDTSRVEKTIQIARAFQESMGQEYVAINVNSNNMGCKYGVKNAIDWAFRFENELIIIEDDVDYSQNFLDFCDYGLEYYHDNFQVFQLNGWTPLSAISNENFYLYSTAIPHIWGWATWKNRWEKLDIDLLAWGGEAPSTFPIFRNEKLSPNFDHFWDKNFRAVKFENYDTWDISWTFSIWKHDGLSISPNHSLTKNLGFDENATHTKKLPDSIFNLQLKSYLANKYEESLSWGNLLCNVNPRRHDVDHMLIAFSVKSMKIFNLKDKTQKKIKIVLKISGLMKLTRLILTKYLMK